VRGAQLNASESCGRKPVERFSRRSSRSGHKRRECRRERPSRPWTGGRCHNPKAIRRRNASQAMAFTAI
jgi:hypothetical protein